LKKYPKSIPHFYGVGDYFCYNENKLDYPKKLYENVHHINIEVLEEKTKYLQKYFTHFQVLELYFSNCHKF
jgi:hypothetical protein